jgi:hypothetical protein
VWCVGVCPLANSCPRASRISSSWATRTLLPSLKQLLKLVTTVAFALTAQASASIQVATQVQTSKSTWLVCCHLRAKVTWTDVVRHCGVYMSLDGNALSSAVPEGATSPFPGIEHTACNCVGINADDKLLMTSVHVLVTRSNEDQTKYRFVRGVFHPLCGALPRKVCWEGGTCEKRE